MHMTTIRYMVTIADCKSFTRAAEKLYITQPALSQAIQRFEKGTGIQIFIRDRQGKLEVTPQGLSILEKCRQILALDEELETELALAAQTRRQTLTFGAAATYQTFFLSRLFSDFYACEPSVRINLTNGFSRGLCAMVRDGTLDFALVCDPEDPSLASTLAFREEVYLASAASHPLPTLESEDTSYPVVDLAKCSNERFIGFTSGRRVQELLLDVTRDAGFRPNICATGLNTQAANSMVYHNMGISVIPAVSVRLCPPDQRPLYYRLREGGYIRTWHIVYKTFAQLTYAQRTFLSFLKNYIPSDPEKIPVIQ